MSTIGNKVYNVNNVIIIFVRCGNTIFVSGCTAAHCLSNVCYYVAPKCKHLCVYLPSENYIYYKHIQNYASLKIVISLLPVVFNFL